MSLKTTCAAIILTFSCSIFAASRIECQNYKNDFFRLKKITSGSEPTWDLVYRFDDPIDGISRIFEGERENLKCTFDTNNNLAPSFYCMAEDGWKTTLNIDIHSSFETNLPPKEASSSREAKHFIFQLVNERAGRLFLGKSPWSTTTECKWTW